MSFIPLIIRQKNLFSSEASLKYFLTQALASSVFFFSIICLFFILNYKFYNFNLVLISSAILLKIGAAPFHFWLPRVIEGLNWTRNLILITWQKIAPLIILSYCLNFDLISSIIILCIIFGRLGGLNQTSLRKLMAFSSINHIGWIFRGIIFNEKLWLIYFFFYIFLNICIVFNFYNFKIFFINQTFFNKYSNYLTKLFTFRVLLSLGGLPPFLGFFPKWIIIESIIFYNLYLTLFIMLFLTLITLYFYLRIAYFSLLLHHTENKWNFKINRKIKNSKILLFTSFISIFGIFLINLCYYFI